MCLPEIPKGVFLFIALFVLLLTHLTSLESRNSANRVINGTGIQLRMWRNVVGLHGRTVDPILLIYESTHCFSISKWILLFAFRIASSSRVTLICVVLELFSLCLRFAISVPSLQHSSWWNSLSIEEHFALKNKTIPWASFFSFKWLLTSVMYAAAFTRKDDPTNRFRNRKQLTS